MFAIVSLLAVPTAYAQVGAVPTYDTIVDATIMAQSKLIVNAINSSGNVVSTSIQTSQKAVTETLNQANENEINTQAKKYALEQRRQNAELYSRSVGAKAKPSCGAFRQSKSMMAAQNTRKNIYLQTQGITQNHLERNRYASPNEPIDITSANKIFSAFKQIDEATKLKNEQDKGALIDVTNSGLSTKKDKNGQSEYLYEVTRNNYLVSPFPDKLPPNYNNPNQPASVAMANATAKIKIERLKDASAKINKILSNRASVYDDNWAKSWYSMNDDGIKMKALSFGSEGAQGWYSTLEAANRYRIMNPDWVKYTSATALPQALARDSNLMFAQSLANQHEMISLLADVSDGLAKLYALQVEQNGRNDKLSINPTSK